MRTAVQIGTNNGNDEFFQICKKENFDKIYLIEPNYFLYPLIQKQYYGMPYEYYSCAINPKDINGSVELYTFSENGAHNSLSKRKSHPIRQQGKDVPYEVVPCLTFSQFCEVGRINEIELLYIDTEGLDDEIILSIPFDKINIQKIIWEFWDHDDDDENGVYQTGTKVQTQVKEKLLGLNYKISNPIKGLDAYNLCAVKE